MVHNVIVQIGRMLMLHLPLQVSHHKYLLCNLLKQPQVNRLLGHQGTHTCHNFLYFGMTILRILYISSLMKVVIFFLLEICLGGAKILGHYFK